MFIGGLFVLAGIGAIFFPVAAGLAVNVVIGISLLLVGTATIVHTLLARSWRAYGWSFFGGLVDLIAGGLMLFYPLAGVSALALVLIAWLLFAGAARISVGWRQRPDRGWLGFVAAGVVSIVLAAVVFIGWPALSAIALGVLAGVHFIFGGMSLLALTRAARHAHPAADDSAIAGGSHQHIAG
jgi:uncharacterized membrane protein HdeD (DUF308 family)